MIFSELYSAYYNAVAAIISGILDSEHSEKELQKIVAERAFGESLLTIMPSLKNEKWQLVHSDMTTPLERKPTMPLTTLQKQWLKAISLDPRVKLFGVEFPNLDDVEPLFTPEDYYVYDKYSDGDPLREASDEICLKYGLSVIKNPKGHTPRNIYFDEKAGKPTRYNLMRWAIDEARKISPTWQDFILHLRDRGFEFDRNEGGKYPKIKPKDGKQWTRIYNLGEDYSLASIDKTIEANYWKGLCGYASYVGKVKNNNIRNLRHPPRQHWLYAPERDYGPLLTLALTFVYLLGGPDLITPNNPAPKYQPITPEMREATRKCEMYSRQAVLMGQEDINTKEDADAFLERAERELMALERKRKDLYNSIRRCNDPEIKAQIQEEIHALTAEMKPLRRQISDIKNVLERSGVMREMVEAEEKMRREKLEREYFLNPKEKVELKNTQPKSSEPQAQPRKRDDDRGR